MERRHDPEHQTGASQVPQHVSQPVSQQGGSPGPAAAVSPQRQGQVFDPEELHALGQAFERSVEAMAPPPWAERQPGADHYAKETVAKVILGVARSGERNPEVIAAVTVDRLTI